MNQNNSSVINVNNLSSKAPVVRCERLLFKIFALLMVKIVIFYSFYEENAMRHFTKLTLTSTTPEHMGLEE